MQSAESAFVYGVENIRNVCTKIGHLIVSRLLVIVQEPHAIVMAKWEIIAREFLTVAYISMNPAW